MPVALVVLVLAFMAHTNISTSTSILGDRGASLHDDDQRPCIIYANQYTDLSCLAAPRSFLALVCFLPLTQATEALRITAPELVKFGVMDTIIPEPLGGAHADPAAAFPNIKATIMATYKE